MRTDKQIEASRRNGAKSRGPKTSEGKAKSALNATTHALAGSPVSLVNDEDEEIYTSAVDRYVRRFQPADDTETEMVQMMAAASWRLRRIGSMEIAMFNCEMENQRERIEREYESIGTSARQYLAFEAIAADGNKALLLHRYELRALRYFNTALKNLMKLQADRKSSPPPAAPSPEPQKHTEPNEPENPRDTAGNGSQETPFASAAIRRKPNTAEPNEPKPLASPKRMAATASALPSLWQQSDNVPFEQSINVPLTAASLGGCKKDSY